MIDDRTSALPTCESLAADVGGPAVPVRLARPGEVRAPLAVAADFDGQAGRLLLSADGSGAPQVHYGLGAEGADAAIAAMGLRGLSARLGLGDYRLVATAGLDPEILALAWALGARSFRRFKSEPPAQPAPRLLVAADVADGVRAVAEACALACDLVDSPANAMGPAEIEAAVRAVAARRGAAVACVTGDDLLSAGYPAVHAVGRAAAPHRAPRMLELTWTGPGGEGAPRLVLVGKGVAFDTGGLDLKPSAGMRWMKKDMGGAAHALALADLVMARALPVRLHLLIPAVENAVSADAMRPGDVLDTRAGLTVEVGNTDAEGRLILADALTRAGELDPDLTIDLATLTGAARVALGPQVAPVYTPDDALAADLLRAAAAAADPLWRMPLWAPYDESLASDVADLRNDADAWAQAGSVTAALFLQRFAPKTGAWAHFDIFSWNPRARPGWPQGAEAQAIRALDRVLLQRYGARP